MRTRAEVRNPGTKTRHPGRRLADLAGVGKRTLEDFRDLGIRDVEALAKQRPQRLYERLSALKGVRLDPCVLDTFTCAIAQARDPKLPADQRNWWYWSRVRKGQIAAPDSSQAPADRGR